MASTLHPLMVDAAAAEEVAMIDALWRLALVAGFTSMGCAAHVYHVAPRAQGYSMQRQVLSGAWELERATWDLYRSAESDPYVDRSYRHRLLNRLDRLHDRARDFRREVERRSWEDHRAGEDFERVVRELYRTEEEIRYRGSRGLHWHLDRVQSLVNRLHHAYAGRTTYYR